MTDSPCRAALRALAAGRLIEAAPLPPGCSLADVDAELPTVSNSDSGGLLGEGQVSVSWRAAYSGISGRELVVWHDGSAVLAIELERPEIAGGWPAAREALGAPDAKLDFYADVARIEGGQWVYAARGIAAFMGLTDDEIDRVLVFPPTTVAEYRRRLARAVQPPRELPARP